MFMDWAQDRSGNPIFGSSNDYVSSTYPSSVRHALGFLDIATPNASWINRNLSRLVQDNSLHGANRTLEWYSDLAKVILSSDAARPNTAYMDSIGDIPLIPLANGTWHTAPTTSAPIYFPQSIGTTIPSGLPLTLVAQTGCECPHRMRLFRMLGVKICDVSNIIERIIDYHKTLRTANHSDVLGHARYLYRAKAQIKSVDMEMIWFSDSECSFFRKGINLYTDKPGENKLCDLFSGYEDAHFLHSDYFKDLDSIQKKEFIEWLELSAKIATVPRIGTSLSVFGSIHKDFLWLLQNKRDRVLSILRKNWKHYITQMSSSIESQLMMHDFICQSGDRVPLRETYLPLPRLVERSRELCGTASCSFLSLPDGEPTEWMFLSRFGVGTAENLEFYLWLLKQPQFKTGSTVERSKKLYCEIQSRVERSETQKVK
jgi:hypothetical protein